MSEINMAGIARQYRKNATQLQEMADKAVTTGRKVNGYTGDQLQAHARRYREMATRAERAAAKAVPAC